MSVEVKIRKGETLDKAIRRLKKKLEREGTVRSVREKKNFIKPSKERREREKRLAFSDMIRRRYQDA